MQMCIGGDIECYSSITLQVGYIGHGAVLYAQLSVPTESDMGDPMFPQMSIAQRRIGAIIGYERYDST
jgi:hypothetical protein